jgi:hypothetical protein
VNSASPERGTVAVLSTRTLRVRSRIRVVTDPDRPGYRPLCRRFRVTSPGGCELAPARAWQGQYRGGICEPGRCERKRTRPRAMRARGRRAAAGAFRARAVLRARPPPACYAPAVPDRARCHGPDERTSPGNRRTGLGFPARRGHGSGPARRNVDPVSGLEHRDHTADPQEADRPAARSWPAAISR